VALSEPVYGWVAVAPGRVAEPMASLGPATVNISVAAVVCCGELASLTATPMVKVPLTVGVPEMMPPEAERARPAGSWPEVIDHAYGAVPPVALTLALYGVARRLVEREVVEMASVATPLLGEAIMTGTAWDSSPVSLFWTWTWAVPGRARLPPCTGAARVLASTMEVLSWLPFQRMTALLVKLVPTTFTVRLLVPTAIVCGRTWLIFGTN
jgi:hypothetical protein